MAKEQYFAPAGTMEGTLQRIILFQSGFIHFFATGDLYGMELSRKQLIAQLDGACASARSAARDREAVAAQIELHLTDPN